MKRRDFLKSTSAAGLVTIITPTGIVEAFTRQATGSLDAGFANAPMASWPQTWWHWMNGNVTKEGITLDLEAMKRIGVGGFQNFDAGTLIPKGPIVYLSPEWIELKKHAIKEADRLGMEFTMHNCPGWSSSGGPWITPELNMQQVTTSEAFFTGGQQISTVLPKPTAKLNFYKDVYVFAFPSLSGERDMKDLVAAVTANNAPADIKKITGEDVSGIELTAEPGKPGLLQLEFKEPYDARLISVTGNIIAAPGAAPGAGPGVGGAPAGPGGPGGAPGGPGGAPAQLFILEASDDGNSYRRVATLAGGGGGGFGGGGGGGGAAAPTTTNTSFEPVKAKYFRLSSTQGRRITKINFSGASRVPNWMAKANFTNGSETPNPVTNIPAGSIINPDTVVDLTANMDKDGKLTWNAPAGNWTVVRFGHTANGTQNRSAPDTGIGLECDKYSKEAIDFHFNKMMENLIPALGSMGAKGKVGLLIDSYEVGMQNWTPTFPAEFKKRKGYDLVKYLPTFTGRVVGSLDISDRFLWDIRRTNADLMADNYYGRFAELCRQNKIISYTEPYDRGPMEEMQIGSRVDVNMGEFWNGLSTQFQNNYTMRRTTKLAASIVHINGKKVVGAEAFTGEATSAKWQEHPFMMKTLGDKMYTQGLNRVIFHRYAHQPHPTALPGMTMGPWGIHFDRTNTWWEPGKAWMAYMGRSQYLLQQGLFVADLLYFTGENSAVYTKVYPDELTPTPPQGYDYDLINAETILKRATVKNNRITLPDGMSYRVFVLQDYPQITLELLRKLKDMVGQGMTLIGNKPKGTPGLGTFADNDAEFARITTELWGNINGTSITENSVGAGKVIWGTTVRSVLEKQGIKPDFESTSLSGDAPITYIHRKIDNTEMYFLANQRRKSEELVCNFRVSGKQPELWDPSTGKITPVKIFDTVGGITRVPVQLGPGGSTFVVFRNTVPVAKRIKAIVKDSIPVLSTQLFQQRPRKSYQTVSGNFTISLWAKPELDIVLVAQNGFAGQGGQWTDYYAIYPPSGADLYGNGHETAGLTVGRNGVAIWTRGSRKPVFTLAAPVPISGLSHIAVVYKDNTPAIYVNGKMIQQGKKSEAIVHPGIGEAYLSDGASYYNGDMTEPELFTEALSDERIQQLAQAPARVEIHELPVVEIANSSKSSVLFWQNGNYSLQDSTGANTVVQVSGAGSPVELSGPWQVNFPANMGAPAQITIPELTSLHKHPEPGVKYFSGTSAYTKSINIPASSIAAGKKLFLDLGRVEVIAQLKVNGKDLGILWKRPYMADISSAVKAGANTIEVKVTNLWPNRLIGDEEVAEMYKFPKSPAGVTIANQGLTELPDWYKQGLPKPNDGRVAFTTWKHYLKGAPLLESGLIGPVLLRTAIEKTV